MAELLLKVAGGPIDEDGDVLSAFNRRRIRQCHAEMICHPWRCGVNSAGWRLADCLARHLRESCYQYRFDVLDSKTLQRTNQWTGEIDLFGPLPNEKGERIDLPLFLSRRRRQRAPDGGPKAAIFGESGKEFWFGGRYNPSNERLDRLWARIEEKTSHRESNPLFGLWPLTVLEKRSYLALAVDDFADEQAAELTAPLVDATDPKRLTVVARRRYRIDWRRLPGMDAARIADVRDRRKEVDLRLGAAVDYAAALVDKAAEKIAGPGK